MLKQWRYALLVGWAVAVTLFISACGGDGGTGSGNPTSVPATLGTPGQTTCIAGTLVVSGSTALQPLVTKVAADYTKACPGSTITVQGGGSSVGKANVEAGSVGIGN